MIRLILPSDENEIKQIHEKYYQSEFLLPDFNKFIASFVIIDDDKIIIAGGVRTIAESILITNKDFSPKARRAALYEALNASSFICHKSGHDQLHAFIQDKIWEKQLKKVGFRDCVGKALVIGAK